MLDPQVVHHPLQQTEFNISTGIPRRPAVDLRRYPRPQDWNRLLLERRSQAIQLLNLDTINLQGSSGPTNRMTGRWRIARHSNTRLLKRFGKDALIKMLSAYRRGLTTERAIDSCFHVAKADFEKGYLAYLDEVIEQFAPA